MSNILQDISTITTISELTLKNLSEKSELCICHSVCENIIEGNPITEIDIGIGLLYIKCEGDEIKYKFIPSKTLEKNVSETVLSKSSPLVYEIETTLKKRVEGAYKNLL